MGDEIKVIDAQYWTNWQADYLAGAIERRDAAANRLITALTWFWSVYTASAVIGPALAEVKVEGWELLVVLAPIATLSCAYLCALWALNPIASNARQTESGALQLWNDVLDRKLLRLRVSSGFLALSVLLIVLSAYFIASP